MEGQEHIGQRSNFNRDVPLEAVVKWLVKERDGYKKKLDILVPYTRSLEKKVVSLEKTVEKLRKENSGLTHDITVSPIYKGLQERYNKVSRTNKDLLLKIAKTYRIEVGKNTAHQ